MYAYQMFAGFWWRSKNDVTHTAMVERNMPSRILPKVRGFAETYLHGTYRKQCLALPALHGRT